MNLETVFHTGDADKPAVLFIHGLGMNKDIWVDPSNARILGGKLPLKILLGEKPPVKKFGFSTYALSKSVPEFSIGEEPGDLKTLFDDLKLKGYTVITWSQERPDGPIDSVVSELRELIKLAHTLTKAGIILIGHSRGGLIGRKYLLRKDKSIRGFITISSPHMGSSVARIASYLNPLASLISPLFGNTSRGALYSALKYILEFLKSKALQELLPESSFLSSLKDGPLDWIHYISIGGTEPTLLTLYKWSWNSTVEEDHYRWIRKTEEIFSIPDVLEKVIPANLYPEEMKKGKGDCLVSAESSKIPWSDEHYNFALNHAQILFDKGVRDLMVNAIERIG